MENMDGEADRPIFKLLGKGSEAYNQAGTMM